MAKEDSSVCTWSSWNPGEVTEGAVCPERHLATSLWHCAETSSSLRTASHGPSTLLRAEHFIRLMFGFRVRVCLQRLKIEPW